MTDYAPGTPSWVDVVAPDFDAAVSFYGELFGWTLADPPPQDFGGYRNFLDDGRTVGGIHPMGEVAVWSTYVSTDDADATAARVRDAGGQVVSEPMAVGDLGRMAIFADPQGAMFGVWEPGAHRGAEKVNAPGSLCWNELHTTDRDAARGFYEGVFGWTSEEAPIGEETYVVFNLAGRAVAGAGQAAEQSHWLAWFAVADADDVAARAAELGGSVAFGPADVPTVGRTAVLADPSGARFGVLQPESAEE